MESLSIEIEYLGEKYIIPFEIKQDVIHIDLSTNEKLLKEFDPVPIFWFGAKEMTIDGAYGGNKELMSLLAYALFQETGRLGLNPYLSE